MFHYDPLALDAPRASSPVTAARRRTEQPRLVQTLLAALTAARPGRGD